MTSKEFERRIKELGFQYYCDTSEIEEGIIVEYARNKDGRTLLCTSNSYLYDIDTAWPEFDCLSKEEKDELFYIFYRYIKTDIHKRGLTIEKKEKTVTEFNLKRN
ncbi:MULTISPECIES: hypothetical protein [Staphylococcus]|uniref:hypothetical protein n=1 Tax=Staphylococcus TaxID=1279 RepID=UPI00145A24E5|nr:MULTISPECIES: hypothetical protein [Staphylococcus]MCG1174840.1 hypothetical protein [Staphylococcus epidermidis]MCG2353351.1 hypothetical protein [Staphylococcus epidermidis]MDS3920102.1 hypothetical protein [Staphylococcus epidermidis]NMK72419.1 hypothetical protein [Staphylococcus capitis]